MNNEAELVKRAVEAAAQFAWVVGECAFEWTRKFARGRTDRDFAELVGLSDDQIYTRRRVWEVFGQGPGDSVPIRNLYPALAWSHFHNALNWPDRDDCLAWAQDNEASVAEMRAWRRMHRGDDLTTEATPELEPVTSAMSPAPAPAAALIEPTESERATSPSAERSKAQQLKTIILKVRRAAREAKNLFGTEDGSLVLADELSAISDDLRQGEEVTGLDKQTLSDRLKTV